MVKSAYIHIPFCKSKCKYCSFVSFTKLDNNYINRLLSEIDEYYRGEELNTLYFGGGTPSLLKIGDVQKLIKNFNLTDDTEVTFEINPDDANLDYLKDLQDIGINRLSFGAQTFDDKILKEIGRRHTSEDVFLAVKLAKEAGFENINLDLIYGLPNTENLDILKNDLNIITKLGVQHISTYGLKIDEGSFFYKHPPKNVPDDDTQADMYLEINNFLEKSGYKRYEISNFALPQKESRHNLNYWNNSEYYGFGVAAHGYVNGIRYSNHKTFEEYSKCFREFEHTVTASEKLEEEIFLGFRKEKGINTKKLKTLFDIDFEKKYEQILNKYVPQYIVKTPEGFKFTLDGVLLSNIILADFLV